MYRTLNIHNAGSGIIKITLWSFPKTGGAIQENIETECGYVAINQDEGFKVDNISVGLKGELRIDIDCGEKAGEHIVELKDYPDSDPPYKCLRIQAQT